MRRMREKRLEEMREKRGELMEKIPAWMQGDNEYLSEKNRRAIAEIAKRLEDYEEFARSAGSTTQDRAALFSVLNEVGVVNEEFVKNIRDVGRTIEQDVERAHEKFYKKFVDRDGSKNNITVKNEAAIAKHTEKVQKEVDRILDAARGRGLTLFEDFMSEVVLHAYAASIDTKIKIYKGNLGDFGLSAALQSVERMVLMGVENKEQAAIVSWFRLAEKGAIREREEKRVKMGVTPQQALEVLQDVAFGGEQAEVGWRIAVPGVRWRGTEIFCTVRVGKDASAWEICEIHLENANGVHIADGFLSRITGDITAEGTRTVAVGDVFSFFQKRDVYHALKKSILVSVYELWQKNTFAEEVNVADFSEESEGKEGDVREKEANPVTPGNRRLTQEEFINAMRSQYGEEKMREKREIQEKGELSGYSWLRVLHAFRRCGIVVVMEGDHPKLKYEGRTIDYINRHEPDPRRNRAVVNRVLRAFGISKETFKKNLY